MRHQYRKKHEPPIPVPIIKGLIIGLILLILLGFWFGGANNMVEGWVEKAYTTGANDVVASQQAFGARLERSRQREAAKEMGMSGGQPQQP